MQSNARLGDMALYSGTDYNITREDSSRFIFNNSQDLEYGADINGRLCPLLTAENITIPQEDIYYNGNERRLENIEVSYADVVLTENIDYRVTYRNNINAGEQALVKIQGVGSYSGVYSHYFTIKPSLYKV